MTPGKIDNLAHLGVNNDLASGAMLVERVLQDTIREGLKRVTQHPEILDDLFFKLDETTRVDIKRFFVNHPVAVRFGLSDAGQASPMVAIVAESEDEDVSTDVLGNYLGQTCDAADSSQNLHGRAERSTFAIYCLASKDVNAALWLYNVVKAVLLLNTGIIEAHGIQVATLSGRELNLVDTRLPDAIYSRVLSFSCHHYFSIRMTQDVIQGLVFTTFPT